MKIMSTTWLRKKIWRWLNAYDDSKPGVKAMDSISRREFGSSFTVYHAQGGTILELHNHSDGRNNPNVPQGYEDKSKLYIIRDDQDLGEELSRILTVEALRKG